MPFTLAHPVAILCFAHNRYFHFPALVLGSMSPDFLYFFSGKPVNGGHTIFGSEWLNLPFCLLFYGIYRFLLAEPLRQYLPKSLVYSVSPPKAKHPLLWLLIFSYSAWLGMVSHIGLDHFTHRTGYFVQHFSLLQQVYILPIYKWLQYAGGIIGLAILLCYQVRRASKCPYVSPKSAQQKRDFWAIQTSLTLMGLGIWQIVQPLAWNVYVNHIIRLVDCWLVALMIQSSYLLGLRYLQKIKHKRPLAR